MIKYIFYFICLFTIVTAIYTAFCKNLVRAVFSFFGTLLGLAGIYIFAMADFIAITQIMVYVGGIIVLMLFGIMLSNRSNNFLLNNAQKTKLSVRSLLEIVLVLGVFIMMLLVIIYQNWDQILNTRLSNGTDISDVHSIGINIMTNFILPFEVISVYLLAVLVGASYLARKSKN